MDLTFKSVKVDKDIKAVYEYNIDAFTDSPDFNWTLEGIKKELKDGWELYSVYWNEEIIAAVFLKVSGKDLITKNTAVKMHHQGSGYNHQIKDFFELKARELGLKTILHYCRIDNFRMYSLNESHGYKKTPNKLESPHVVEWEKFLK